MEMSKLENLCSDYDRYLAIKERQKINCNHGILEMIALEDEFRLVFPKLLKVCDSYIRLLIAYAELDASRFGAIINYDMAERNAKEKLEELLG